MSKEELSNPSEINQRLDIVKNNTCYDIFKPFRKQPRLDKLSDISIEKIIKKIEQFRSLKQNEREN